MNNIVAAQNQPQPPPSAQQTPAENPLDQLRDIHLPDQIDQFPYAPGWWILLALFLITLGYYLFLVYRKQKALRLLKPAKAEISKLKNLPDNRLNAHSIAQLSALLKRVCLIYFPRKTVASLNGHRWLNFLNDRARLNNPRKNNQTPLFFSDADIQLFSQAAYQADPNISRQDWLQLLSSSEKCIESIIRNAANNKVSMTQTNRLPTQSGERV